MATIGTATRFTPNPGRAMDGGTHGDRGQADGQIDG